MQTSFAQVAMDSTLKKTAGELLINYINSDSLVGKIDDSKQYNRLLGHVILEHNGTQLMCDSAYLFQEGNFVEAFGNVHITTASGTDVTSDYLKYTGNNNLAYLKGNVVLQDGANNITSEELTYNVLTKIAKYNKGATLQNEGTQLTSNEGVYNGKLKLADFKGDVVVTDPKYTVESKHLKYQTEKKFVTFLDESTIVTEGSTIQGKKGTYDAIKEVGEFNTRSTVYNDEQSITANKMWYNKKTGVSKANGNVVMEDVKNSRRLLADKTDYNEKTSVMIAIGNVLIEDVDDEQTFFADKIIYNKESGDMNAKGNVIIHDIKEGKTVFASQADYNKKSKYTLLQTNVLVYDSIERSILQCGKLEINEVVNYSLASIKPLIRTLSGDDSLFMKADSFFSAPSDAIDTIKKFIVPKSTAADSIAVEKDKVKRTMLALHHVKIFSDSMQAICDSMSYAQSDSMFKLFKKPILWTRQNQAIADTIYIQTINNKISQLNLKSNASMINNLKANNMYDQIIGDKIDGFLEQEELKYMFVDGSAESIYYSKNEQNEYLGMNKSKSAQMKIIMKEKNVSKIIFYTEPEGTFFPMDKIVEADKKLASFQWQEILRPKKKEEVVGE